jgi:hypothetical protein
VIQSPKAKVQPPKAAALPRAINPLGHSDDDLTLPPETPPPETPKLRRSGRTAANGRIAMMIEQGPKTYRAALDAEDAGQWKEAIGKEVASMESHEVFTCVEKVPEGASMIGSHWVMGRKCYGPKELVCDRLHWLRYAKRCAGIRGKKVTH